MRIALSITSRRSTAMISTDGQSRRTASASDAPIRPKPTMAIRAKGGGVASAVPAIGRSLDKLQLSALSIQLSAIFRSSSEFPRNR